MREIWPVRTTSVFRRLNAEGRRVRVGPVRMTYLPLATERPQMAMAIGRRFGNAVERNRARRRVRHAFAEAWGEGQSADGSQPLQGAFLVSGQRAVLTMSYRSLVEAISGCFARLSGTQQSPADVGHS